MDSKKCPYFTTFLFLYFFFVVTNSCLISIQILSFDRYIFDENVITSIIPITLGSLMLLTWWISTSGCHNKERKEKPTPCVKHQELGLGQLGPNVRFWGWTGAQLSTFTWQKVGPNWDGTMYSSDQHDWNLQIFDGLVDVADPTVLPLHPQVHRQCDRRLFITHLDNFFKRYLWFHLKLNSLIQKKNCHSP